MSGAASVKRIQEKVVGVTFENEDGENRQNIIGQFYSDYGRDLFLLDVDLERYEYFQKPAYRVRVDGTIVGNLSADTAATLADMQDKHGLDVWADNAYIIGGPAIDDDGEEYQLNFGLLINICLYEPQQRCARFVSPNRSGSQSGHRPAHETNADTQENRQAKRTKNIWMLIIGAIAVSNALRIIRVAPLFAGIYGLVGLCLVVLWALSNR